jgi:flagellar motility protein MotE (MotC chaperone)
MQNGYDQFFKQAKKVASTTGHKPKAAPVKTRLELRLSDEEIDNQLRARMGAKKKKIKVKRPFPWALTILSLIGLFITYWGMNNFDKVEHFVRNIEVTLTGEAYAEEATAPAKSEVKDSAKAVAPGSEKDVAGEGAGVDVKDSNQITDDELNHITHLNAKKKELEKKEEELNRMEQELALQKVELEKRMKELDEVRRGISSVLEEKVKVDADKLDTLVQMYTGMKPPQAAKVLEEMDEDLAVEIVSKMKKKNAADILNLLKPEKAKAFSEKFAGYRRK